MALFASILNHARFEVLEPSPSVASSTVKGKR